MFNYKIRRCNGNQSTWILLALTPEGQELPLSSVTSYAIDDLLADSRLPVSKGDKILLEV